MLKHRIRSLSIISLLVAVSIILSACAQQGSPTSDAPAAESKVITVVGQGEAKGVPDQARVNVGVDVFEPEVTQAVEKNEATIKSIMEALAGLGIAAEDIQTSNYSLYAEQRYGDQGAEGISGYRVSNQVSVTIRDIERVSEVLEAVISAGANNIYGVEFTVSDPAALESQAREAAMQDARQRAAELAGLEGLQIGDIILISESFNQVGPLYRYGMGGGAEAAAVPAPSISPGQVSVTSQVQVSYQLK